jgi:hypothetical protein
MKTIGQLCVAMLLFAAGSELMAGDGCPPWRPCGPGNTWGGNRLIGQRSFGADFRPSCATHDACLASGVPRAECDRRFHANMRSACQSSNHPFLCRMKAFKYYAAARLFGGVYY